MSLSCNGCRVLRKGCSENCSIRTCLQWIRHPDSPANATLFLAKFYGRAGLLNLLHAVPQHHRPAIFRSLLYEACGRMVNPISGSVGLMWQGSWQLCQAAVEAVLVGSPITQIPDDTAAGIPLRPLNSYDIRHASKDDAGEVSKSTRTRFKRRKTKPDVGPSDADESAEVCNLRWQRCYPDGFYREPVAAKGWNGGGGTPVAARGAGTVVSVERECRRAEAGEVELELELTLGFEPVGHAGTGRLAARPAVENSRHCEVVINEWGLDTFGIG